MAENETIDGFKRNLGLLVQALASGKIRARTPPLKLERFAADS